MTTPSEFLTPQRALELLRRARDLKGADYTYETPEGAAYDCVYRTPGGAPSCIAGHVFLWAGITDLQEGVSANQIADDNDLPHPVGMILATAQNRQDSGYTWGEAVQAAERMAAHLGVAA